MNSVCIVGACLAGIRAAQTLRGDGFTGKIILVGDEVHKPYDRPPLSKESLSAESVEPVYLVKPEDYEALELDEWLGWSAKSLNVNELSVEIENQEGSSEKITSDAILIATGVRARNIFDTHLQGVHTLRTLDDCQAIKEEFSKSPKRVVVVGAGFIGCEVAATARSLNLEVSMIEMQARPLEQILGAEMGEFLAEIHRQNGVDLRLNTTTQNLVGKERVEAVELGDGTILETDLVIVGVGAVPNIEWLGGSGLTLENGVVCDETCQAAPKVAAAGDVARWKNPRFNELMRVEHWDNAIEQAKVAVRGLTGSAEPYAPIPWFWSDQYEHKLQLSGLSSATDELEIIDGSMAEKKFAALYKRKGKVIGVLGFNNPRLVMKNRQLIEADFPI